jgi:manganese efflux pump family protein
VDIAALILWIVTAGGGFYLLATWIGKGGARAATTGTPSRFPPGLIFGHFGLAVVGLILWIIFVAGGSSAVAWIAFVVLLGVAALGFTMLARWIPTVRAAQEKAAAVADGPPERHFPVPAVAGHGLLAATTLVIVFIAALTA